MRRFIITMKTGIEHGPLSEITLYQEERDEYAKDFYLTVKGLPNVVEIMPCQKRGEEWTEYTQLLRQWEE